MSDETRISTERLQELIEQARNYLHDDFTTALRELAATRREGWVMVPGEPTPEILAAMCPDEDNTGAPYVYDRYVAKEMYANLIASLPAAPTP